MFTLVLLVQTACAAPTKPLAVDTTRFISTYAETPKDTLYAHGDTVMMLSKGRRITVIHEGNLVKTNMDGVAQSFCIKGQEAYLIENGVVSAYKSMPVDALFFIQKVIDTTKRVEGKLSRIPPQMGSQ